METIECSVILITGYTCPHAVHSLSESLRAFSCGDGRVFFPTPRLFSSCSSVFWFCFGGCFFIIYAHGHELIRPHGCDKARWRCFTALSRRKRTAQLQEHSPPPSGTSSAGAIRRPEIRLRRHQGAISVCSHIPTE